MASTVFSIYDYGMEGLVVRNECHMSNGLPGVIIVGMANKAVDEAKERMRSAFSSSSISFPKKRITLNLAPADEPKDSSSLDLSMAVSILIESSQTTDSRNLDKAVFIGELGLDGSVKPVRGIIGKISSAKKSGFTTAIIPKENSYQASIIKDIDLIAVESLREVIAWLNKDPAIGQNKITANYAENDELDIDFSDIVGHEIAKRCLEIAAAGGHNIILNGPPGTGKSMLAKSIISILPMLNEDQMIETTHLHSLVVKDTFKLVKRPPFRAPHHTSSSTSIIGGGQNARPGEISLAHNGVLFLDELPEYRRDCIEALRQPLEDSCIQISRSKRSVSYPAKFMLVATKNPCPCGNYGTSKLCICSAHDIHRYNKKISGPILDRIDIYIDVEETSYELLGKKQVGGQSKLIQERVENARLRQMNRNIKSKLNSQLSSKDFANLNLVSEEANDFLIAAARKLELSARSFIKILRVARTIADIEDANAISTSHISEALQYRNKRASLP